MNIAAPLADADGTAARAPADAPIVDCHAHIFLDDMPVSSRAWTQTHYAFTAADFLATLDQHGVHFGVISGLSIAGYYNDYMLSELRQHPRLRGTAIVAPNTDRYILEQMRTDGVVGIRLQLARATSLPDFRDDEYRLLFRRVRDLGWHVHVAIEGEALRPVLDALNETGVDIVVDHFGHPDPADPLGCDSIAAMLESVDRGRTWIKMSAGFRLLGPSAWQTVPDADGSAIAALVARRLIEKVGPDRLLWGSDAPFVGYEGRVTYARALECFREWVPDAAMRAEMSRTALRLYFA
ncbi:amidohydrolase family protein [Sphingomonas canadensis]|uniref:Amidohydrolase family protein n=1 Tax=Sphingomonas canadensis TaxID=1219257 RepID=A0ABW3H417_9SPHN|nr:amidohydrolase family protein [Sphingomonas canadensis]MCW3835631.1 amidohydrolase family protein [Sphingomonas canadensis]